jgi:molybdenum cofactor synthesis domain-containing protein
VTHVEREPSATVVTTAAALLIGNELLSGKVREANLYELARTLRTLGIRLERVVMTPDDLDGIAREVRAVSAAADAVFTSGGIGPTHDDVTVAAVAEAFGVEMCLDPDFAALVQDTYGEQCTEAHLRMARVPAGSTLATAPDNPWPIVVTRNVWMLPGVPEVFRMKLLTIRSLLRGPNPFVTRAVLTRVEEPALASVLKDVVARHPNVEIGSYPKWRDPEYKTKITIDGRDCSLVEAALATVLGLLTKEQIHRVE